MAEPQRIAKLLARAGIASRREIERMIEARRIAIDGIAIETPATIVRSLKGVTVDGQPVAEPDHARLFLYHKPTGLLTAANDPAGRKTIYDRMPEGLPRVVPVGRLDLNTEGLLLLTTDGGLKRELELPATGVERTYRARCYGAVTQEQLELLSEGIEIEGIRYGSIDANLERRTGANQWIELRLREGKNREVRRVLEYLGLEVNRLIRTAYGPFVLADLPVAGAVEVLQHDLVAFLKDLKMDAARAARSAPRTVPIENAGPRPPRPVRAGATPRPVRPSDAGTGGGERARRSAAGGQPVVRPCPTPIRSDERTAQRRSSANPHKAVPRKLGLQAAHPQEASAAIPTRAPEAEPAGERPARPARGKGWAKASKPAKRVGVGAGRPKRAAPRADRPMTDAREDFHAEPAPRPQTLGARPGRGRPAGNAPMGRPPRSHGPTAPRPPRPGRK